jgi:hypothetical protein
LRPLPFAPERSLRPPSTTLVDSFRPRGFAPPRRFTPQTSREFVAPHSQPEVRLVSSRTRPPPLTEVTDLAQTRRFPAAQLHTPRRIPLASSRTVSPRPLPSCGSTHTTPRSTPSRSLPVCDDSRSASTASRLSPPSRSQMAHRARRSRLPFRPKSSRGLVLASPRRGRLDRTPSRSCVARFHRSPTPKSLCPAAVLLAPKSSTFCIQVSRTTRRPCPTPGPHQRMCCRRPTPVQHAPLAWVLPFCSAARLRTAEAMVHPFDLHKSQPHDRSGAAAFSPSRGLVLGRRPGLRRSAVLGVREALTP